MREYGKLHTSFWTSQDIRSMTEDGRTLAAYLITSPHSNMLGCYRVPLTYASDDLKWSIERVSEGFGELYRKGFATLSEGSNWVVIHRFLKWNQLENPNVVKAAVKLFDQIPDQCGVKHILAEALREFEPRFPTEKLNPFDTVSKPFGKGCLSEETPFRKPEPEPEPEPEPKKTRTAKFDPQSHLETMGVEASVARDWLTLRKGKRLNPTETAFAGVKSEADKAGLSMGDALRMCCLRGWGGFEARWLDDKSPRVNGRSTDNVFG